MHGELTPESLRALSATSCDIRAEFKQACKIQHHVCVDSPATFYNATMVCGLPHGRLRSVCADSAVDAIYHYGLIVKKQTLKRGKTLAISGYWTQSEPALEHTTYTRTNDCNPLEIGRADWQYDKIPGTKFAAGIIISGDIWTQYTVIGSRNYYTTTIATAATSEELSKCVPADFQPSTDEEKAYVVRLLALLD